MSRLNTLTQKSFGYLYFYGFVLVAFSVFPSFSYAATSISGIISTDTVWTKAESPYVVHSVVRINSNIKLTIDPGVIVKFYLLNSFMDVNGTLQVNGTAADRVYFTSLSDDSVGGDTGNDGNATSPQMGDWFHIEFNSGSVGNINNAVIRYAGRFLSVFQFGSFSGIYNSGGTLNIYGSEIDHNGFGNFSFGIRQDSGNLNITQSSIHDNGYGIFNVSNNVIQAVNNWWGSPTGPFHSVLNPSGTGNRVSDKVNFIPWLGFDPTQNQPPVLSGQGQFKSDGTTAVPEGGLTVESSPNNPLNSIIVFKAVANDPNGDQVKLQVELKESNQAFDGQNFLESGLVSSGSEITLTRDLLNESTYKWRARAVDDKGATSDWQEFGTPGNTDFEVKLVPLYTQVESDFPSQTETISWARKIYANGLGDTGNDPCGLLIRDCGCAITSAVMVLRYYDITTATDNQDINPFNINSWLNSNSGYVGSGALSWLKVSEYSKDSSGLARLHFDDTRNLGDNLGTTFNDLLATTDTYVNSGRPVILWSRDYGHYLVAIDKLSNTYAVRDPRWYNTRTLNSGFTSESTKIRNYNNQFAGVRLYSRLASGGPVDGISFDLASPAELLVTDPQGRRLGKDPESDIFYNEIPNASYVTDGISNAETDVSLLPHEVKNLWISAPISGIYDVKVIGTATGTYTFSSLAYDQNSNSHQATFTGSTTPNLEAEYTLNFSPAIPEEILAKEVYKFLGFLPPVKVDGSGIYKLGRTLPIKFQLKNSKGEFVSIAVAKLSISKIQNGVLGNDSITLSTAAADSGNIFRYDSTNNQYIYNLSTTNLSAGAWQLKVILDDGKNYIVVISLK